MQRITIYGWVQDENEREKYALVDLVYFISDDLVTVEDIFSIVNHSDYRMVSKKIPGTNTREKDRISVENWNQHIKIGTEQIGPGPFNPNPYEGGQYDRYNTPHYGSSM